MHALNNGVVKGECLFRRNEQRAANRGEVQNALQRQLGELEGVGVVERKEREEHSLVADGGVPVAGQLNQVHLVAVGAALRPAEVT